VAKKTRSRRRSAKKTRSRRRKVKTRPKRRSNVARKKGSRSRSKSRGIKGIFSSSGILGKAAIGIGAATVTGAVVAQVAPQFNDIAKLGASFIAGGPVGLIANLLVGGGGLGQLWGLFGGGGQQAGGESL